MIKFINSAINSPRFMTNSLSNFVDNLAEGIHKITCKYCSCFLKYEIVNDNLIKYKYLPLCIYLYVSTSNKIHEKLKKRFRIHLRFPITILINLCCC